MIVEDERDVVRLLKHSLEKEGLEVSANDYVSKLFGMRELVARVRTLLRRNAESGVRDRP